MASLAEGKGIEYKKDKTGIVKIPAKYQNHLLALRLWISFFMVKTVISAHSPRVKVIPVLGESG